MSKLPVPAWASCGVALFCVLGASCHDTRPAAGGPAAGVTTQAGRPPQDPRAALRGYRSWTLVNPTPVKLEVGSVVGIMCSDPMARNADDPH